MSNPRLNAYLSQSYRAMLDDLHYPVAKGGAVMDATAIKAWVAWHLVRCGWRRPHDTELDERFDTPIIKKRKVYGPGVFEDAVTWVGFGEPDDPLEHLADMTMGDIEALPEDVKLEAKRRLGLAPTPEPECNGAPLEPAWSVQPFIQIIDAEQVDDETQWNLNGAQE